VVQVVECLLSKREAQHHQKKKKKKGTWMLSPNQTSKLTNQAANKLKTWRAHTHTHTHTHNFSYNVTSSWNLLTCLSGHVSM
jgi:hypothetical protein